MINDWNEDVSNGEIRIERMTTERFDAVVVGSGFGGAVMAYRLAEAGLSVCVLERGKAYPPGSFPRAPHDMAGNFWAPQDGLYGLFDVRSFRGKLWSIVSSGLGGGSLIYAGTLHRKDESWFVQEDSTEDGYEYWPVTRAQLDPHYDRVERMLAAQRYPFETHAPYNETPKTRQFQLAAKQLGLEWELPNLGIAFGNQNSEPKVGVPLENCENLHGAGRVTCRLCGECNLGCNSGSKNSLDFNYLSESWRLGADIRTLCEVRHIAPRANGGYAVRYVQHVAAPPPDRSNGSNDLTEIEVAASRLILAAGTYGTVQLLLRNTRSFPHISRMLGHRFSGNGNLLTFAVNARAEPGDGPRRLDPWRGPVITSAVRVPDTIDGDDGRGFYIEDSGFPLLLAWVLETAQPSAFARLARFAVQRQLKRLSRHSPSTLGDAVATALGNGEISSSSMPLLGIGRDVPNGVLAIHRGELDVNWPEDLSRDYYERVRETACRIAQAWRAEFRESPFWGVNRHVTVHPLGGCSMGRNESEGVVDDFGQVFNYPGLFIADGSVMPGPVGANPSLTIAALADRFADRIVDE